MANDKDRGIAIIGMAGRFPRARNVDQFWNNIVNGVESVSFFSDEQVQAAGVPPEMLKHPDYVKAWGVLEDMELFDASYFGIPAREAEAMDPQHRHFLEVSATALDDAGYDPEKFDGNIGVISGVGISTYILRNIMPNAERFLSLGEFHVFIGNDKDFCATRTAYKLNLRGAAHAVSCGCSTTMVAIHHGCRALLTYQDDMFIAGGANIKLPQEAGYLFKKGEFKSPDGRCRAFDAKAKGTVFSNGAAVVVLKRLKDALRDGDHIYAVIKGSAINNDGSSKVGFTAPSVSGQAAAIAEAHAMANLPIETITHIEAHGTATELGDPIEMKALHKVFKSQTDKKHYCAMTSVKTNVGHLDNCAGVTGMIKTALTLKNKQIPPSLNFETPNPEIDFENSPFYVNTELQDWNPPEGIPRRACVSAFGAGGTNAHAVLEEAPERGESGQSRAWQILKLAAKTDTALETMTQNLIDHLKANPGLNIADVAYTAAVGRGEFNFRRAVVVKDVADAIAALGDASRAFTGSKEKGGGVASSDIENAVQAVAAAKSGDALNSAMSELAKLWATGGDVDWRAFYKGETRFRLRLPTYPFEGKRYWVEQPAHGFYSLKQEKKTFGLVKNSLAKWFYTPTWRRSVKRLHPAEAMVDKGCWLLFADEKGLGDALAKRLRQEHDQDVIVIRAGEAFEQTDEHTYVIDAMNPEEYNGLLTDLHGRGKVPQRIAHLWSVGSNGNTTLDVPELEDAQKRGFFSLVYLAQAIGIQKYSEEISLFGVTNYVQRVQDGDVLRPEKATLIGPMRVIGQEQDNVSTRCLDVALPSNGDFSSLAESLIVEMNSESQDEMVAYRGKSRFVETFEPVPLDESDAQPLVENGVYVVTGGLGGIGLTLAEHLAEKAKARLILTGRSAFPKKGDWDAYLTEHEADDPTAIKINKLRALEEKGATIQVVKADVASREDMQRVAAAADSWGGRINGVIHAAGSADVGVVQRMDVENAEKIMAGKVRGTLVLLDTFKDKGAEFIALCSSLASIMGGYGQAAYVAANQFMDSLAQHHDGESPRLVAINWDAWREVGMASGRQTDSLQQLGILNEEGCEAFDRAVGGGIAQVMVSTSDFNVRFGMHQDQMNKGALLEAVDEKKAQNRYPRPEMSSEYVEPRNEIEQMLADDWAELLGLDKVGIEDNFFELGGDSLKGMNLVNTLEKKLGEVFHIETLFDTSTISELTIFLQENYQNAIAKLFGGETLPQEVKPEDKLTEEQVRQFRGLIPSLPARIGAAGAKNPKAAFVLGPPRSGSTLLRVMLAGNSKLFAPPELFLLGFNNIQDRKAAFPGDLAFWTEGLTHAIMTVKTCSDYHAASIVQDWERLNATSKEVYHELQSWIGKQLLVDKTPSYAYDMATLKRAEMDFDNPLYLHLQRHPEGMIKSYLDAKMDLLIRHHFKGVPFNGRQIAELIWLVSHQNIENFFKEIPQERRYAVRFEDLVKQPAETLQGVCDFLGVPYEEDMLKIHKETHLRMTDGVNSQSRMLGDMKFHQHKGIDPNVADAWMKHHTVDFLGEATWDLAKSYGYEQIEDKAPAKQSAGVDQITRADSDDTQALLDSVDSMDEAGLDAMLGDLMNEDDK